MANHSGYALEKLSSAIHYLTVGEGDVRQRLRSAYREFSAVSETDFPPRLQDDWKWIMAQLTQYGTIEDTLSRIRNSTGVKIVQRIIYLRDELESHLER